MSGIREKILPAVACLREKARMPRSVHGDEVPIWGLGWHGLITTVNSRPQDYVTFSLEEAPTFGRGSLLQDGPVSQHQPRLGFYTIQGMGLNDPDRDVYGLMAADSNGDHDSFSFLGECYIQVTGRNTNLKIGRLEMETPWVNTGDNRLTPQFYKAYALFIKAFLIWKSLLPQ